MHLETAWRRTVIILSVPTVKTSALFSALALTAALGALIGCGGDGSTTPGLTDATTANPLDPTINPYQGSYQASTALDDGKTGTTDLIVGADGSANGTLTVVAGTTPATRFSLPVGTYSLAGTVDPDSGAFALVGTVPELGELAYSGTLPSSGADGAFTLTAGGDTWTGTIPAGSTDGGTNGGEAVVAAISTLAASNSTANLSLQFLNQSVTVGAIVRRSNPSGTTRVYTDLATAQWPISTSGPLYSVNVNWIGLSQSLYGPGVIEGGKPSLFGRYVTVLRSGGGLGILSYYMASGSVNVTRAEAKTFTAIFHAATFKPVIAPALGTGSFTLNGTLTLK
ncbi:hypothetical protein BH11ARM2_BH11ARM2_19000 [soil metagenome]